MVKVCAWCGKVGGEIEPVEDRRATHGICEPCLHAVWAQEREPEGKANESLRILE